MKQVADWRLEELAGRGGMGEVHRARHLINGQSAAVKLLRSGRADDPGVRRRFQLEARAVARLDHPNVVRVYDVGEEAGQPWIAMEWVEGGTLADALPGDFEELRAMGLALFRGLAHAHSHDVVHLDVKPANLLRSKQGVWKLADFGIARMGLGGSGGVVGSPSYMAPEQIRGSWSDIGPWTDAYGAGCLLWAAATGKALFWGSTETVLQAHLMGQLPPFQPRFPVPDALEDYLGALLRLAPESRYLFAADAAAALRALGEASGAPAAPASLVGSSTFQLDDDWLPASAVPVSSGVEADFDPTSFRPPVPVDWRPRELLPVERPSLALLGLRRSRLVGRDAQRDTLWAELVDVAGGKMSAVAIAGPAGSGRSRLGAWLCARAYELGVALPVRIDAGLRESLSLRMGTVEMDEAAAERRLVRMLPGLPAGERRLAARALTDPELTSDSALLGFRAVIDGLAIRRPVVLLLEDADVEGERLRLARTLVHGRSWRQPPVLIVTTGAQAPDLPGVRTVELGPLEPGAFRDFLSRWLPVHPELRELLYQRSGGLVGPALGFVRDAAASGALRETKLGYGLVDEGVLEPWAFQVPQSPPAAWTLAALLGPRCSLARLERVAAALGRELDPDALADLVDARGAQWITDGSGGVWGLALEATAREALWRRESAEDRARVAELLEGEDPALAGRLWIEAGQFERGGWLLLHKAVGLHRTGDAPAALALLDVLLEERLDRLSPELACRVACACASFMRQQSRMEEQLEILHHTMARARREAWPQELTGRVRIQLAKSYGHQGLAAQSLEVLGVPEGQPLFADDALDCMMQADVYRASRRLDAGLKLIRHAARLTERPGTSAYERVWVNWMLGMLLRLHGDIDGALQALEVVHALAEPNGYLGPAALALQELAACAMVQGDLDLAMERQERAVALLRRIGSGSDGIVAELNYVLLLSKAGRNDAAAAHVGALQHDPRLLLGERAHCALLQTQATIAVHRNDRTTLDAALEGLIEVAAGRNHGQGFTLMMGELVQALRDRDWDDAADRAAALLAEAQGLSSPK